MTVGREETSSSNRLERWIVKIVSTVLFPWFALMNWADGSHSFVSTDPWVRFYSRLIDLRPPKHAQHGKGWIFPYSELLFASLNCFSVSQWGRACIRRNYGCASHHERQKIDRLEAAWIDTYVAANLVALSLLLILDVKSSWAAAYSVYVIAEMVQRTVNVILFDKFRGHPPPADTRRSLLISVLNVLIVVLGFSVIWYAMPDLCVPLSESENVLDFVRHSAGVSGFTDGLCAEDQVGTASWVNIAQNLATIWTMVIVLSYSIGALPRRE